MAAVESLVSTAFNPKQWEVTQEAETQDTVSNLILASESAKSVEQCFADGIEVGGVRYRLMNLIGHRTKRYNQMWAVISNGDGRTVDVNLPVGPQYTLESLTSHILRALRATSIMEVFKSPVQIGEEYFRLCQLAELTDTAVVIITQSVGLGPVTVSLPLATHYSREDISAHLTAELAKSSQK